MEEEVKKKATKKVAGVVKKTTKKRTTKKTMPAKRSSAKRKSVKKSSKKNTAEAAMQVPIKHTSQKEEYPMADATDTHTVQQMLTETQTKKRITLKQCMSGLYKVASACQPRSAGGAVGLFIFGMVVGVAALVGFIYINKSGTLLRLLSDVGILNIDGVSVLVEEEIDPSFGNLIAKDVPQDFSDVDFNEFWQVWRYIENEFVPPPKKMTNGAATENGEPVDRDALINGAIKGLTLATKDKYTNFFLPKDASDFEDEVLNGEIEGIGAYLTMNKDDILEVAKPIDGGPADQAGLRADDLILTIDGVDSSEYNLSEAASNIRGPRGTTVVLGVYRPVLEEKMEISIVRDKVEIPTVETEIRDGVFVITLSSFTKLTPKAFQEALQEFAVVANAGGPDRILLDIRGNMGGILSVSVYIAGLFLPENSPVLYEYSGTEKLKVYKTDKPAFQNSVLPKMTVLVDGATASAAEILAAALRYYGVADIVGTKTLGKGSVQAVKPVGDDEALLKITVAHWLTPAKKSIDGEGVTPDVDYLAELEALYKENQETDIEEIALKKATEHLMQK